MPGRSPIRAVADAWTITNSTTQRATNCAARRCTAGNAEEISTSPLFGRFPAPGRFCRKL
jgi:hypothetical protein